MSITGAPDTEESRGLELVGFHDLDGNPAIKLALQLVDGRYYLYAGKIWSSGYVVLDVTDAEAPRIVGTVDTPPGSSSHQVQVADGLMIAGLEEPFPGWGYEDAPRPETVGALIYDVATDPARPALLAHVDTTGVGSHRNYYDGGRYLYLASEPDGYVGHILQIIDIVDPRRPVEVGRFAMPGQYAPDGGSDAPLWGLHGPTQVVGDLAYCSWGPYGVVVLDVSDKTAPRLISQLPFGAFGSRLGVHTAYRYGDYLVANSESLDEGDVEGLPYAVAVDIRDPAAPRIVSWFPTPVPSDGLGYRTYQDKGGRHGPHNQHQYQGQPGTLDDPSRVYLTHFNAGLRVYDFSEPLRPAEIAFYVPVAPAVRRGPKPVQLTTSIEDVLVDDRGNIFCTDKNHGLFVLRLTSEAGPRIG